MRMLSQISLKTKDELLLTQTIETPVEDNPEQIKVNKKIITKTKVTTVTNTRTKKKFLKSFLTGAFSVFHLVLLLGIWLAPGRIVIVLLTSIGFKPLISRIPPGLQRWPLLRVQEDGSRL